MLLGWARCLSWLWPFPWVLLKSSWWGGRWYQSIAWCWWYRNFGRRGLVWSYWCIKYPSLWQIGKLYLLNSSYMLDRWNLRHRPSRPAPLSKCLPQMSFWTVVAFNRRDDPLWFCGLPWKSLGMRCSWGGWLLRSSRPRSKRRTDCCLLLCASAIINSSIN